MRLDIAKFKENITNFELGNKGFQQWQVNTLLNSVSGNVSAADVQNVPADIMIQAFYYAEDYFKQMTCGDALVKKIGERVLEAPRVRGKRRYL